MLAGLVGLLALSTPVSAADCNVGTGEDSTQYSTSILPCTGTDGQDNGVWGILILIINIMSGGVGVLAVAGLVYGSIMYSSAGGNAERQKKARSILANVGIGLVLYALMFAVLNYLVPGGLFRS